MLQVILIGNLGADAKVQESNGKQFTTFRVAHTDRWKDDAGVAHESTTWVDCIIDGSPKVLQYLVKGQLVFVSGSSKLRCYSSEKDRCMKAGMTISVGRVELLGGNTDAVPKKLYKGDEPVPYSVNKFFNCPDVSARGVEGAPTVLHSESGQKFSCDVNGWIVPLTNE